MRRGRMSDRVGGTAGLGSFLASERHRLFDGATEQRKEQLRAAERQREVYRAWNSVCAHTREGSHVTGLHYAPASNELVVYTDGAVWTQELTMLREIIRARMELAGAGVSDIVVKTSRPGFRDAASAQEAAGLGPASPGAAAVAKEKEPVPEPQLTPAQRASIDAAVEGVESPKLRESLRRAMIASLGRRGQ